MNPILSFLAQSSAPAATPTSPGEVSSTIKDTLFTVWGDFVEHIPFFSAGLAILLATWAVSTSVNFIGKSFLTRWKLRGSLKDLILRLIIITVWVVGILVAAVVVFPGLTPARAIGGLGLVSVAVGFAFKDIFENFFAGILLLWKFPFENGDYIECEGIEGKVEQINIRMSEIRKTTGELVVVPNAFLFSNPVDVLTNLQHRRVTVMTGVSYDTDVREAVSVIQQAVEECESTIKDQPIQVFPQAFGSSSIDIEVAWWTQSKPVQIRESRAEVVTAIKNALDTAGIEIPFPYRTLTFKEALPITRKTC